MTAKSKRASERARCARWRQSVKGRKWLADRKQARADLRARKLAVLKREGLA